MELVLCWFDKTYFLDFVQKPNKKYSYAASIGGAEVPKEFVPEYGKLLNDFDCITLREKTGALLSNRSLISKHPCSTQRCCSTSMTGVKS